MEKDTVKMSSHFFYVVAVVGWGWGEVDCGWGGGLFFFFFPFPCVCLCISLKHKHKCMHNFFFFKHTPTVVRACSSTDLFCHNHTCKQTGLHLLANFFWHSDSCAHTNTRAQTHTLHPFGCRGWVLPSLWLTERVTGWWDGTKVSREHDHCTKACFDKPLFCTMHRGAAANLTRVLSDKVWMENYFKPGDMCTVWTKWKRQRDQRGKSSFAN